MSQEPQPHVIVNGTIKPKTCPLDFDWCQVEVVSYLGPQGQHVLVSINQCPPLRPEGKQGKHDGYGMVCLGTGL